MTNERHLLIQATSSIRLVLAVLVLLAAGASFFMQHTEASNAFLTSSLNNIKMGMGTDTWQPPAAPTELTCTLAADDSTAMITWVASKTDAVSSESLAVERYEITSLSTQEISTSSATTLSANLKMQDGENVIQVVAVDGRNTPSEPTTCSVQADLSAPVVTITQPTQTVIGTTLRGEAEILEPKLASATVALVAANQQRFEVTNITKPSTENASQAAVLFEKEVQSLASGTYTLEVSARDLGGRVTVATKQVTLDTQAPTLQLSMEAPVASESSLLQNSGFENGLAGWGIQGSAFTSNLGSIGLAPTQGNQALILGRTGSANQVSLVSQDVTASLSQMQSVGFWYQLKPIQGVSATEGMMVFMGDKLVYQDWLSSQTSGWKYVQLSLDKVTDGRLSIAYTHDGDTATGGELYLDGFVINQPLVASDVRVKAVAQDVQGVAKVVVSYVQDGQIIRKTIENEWSSSLAELSGVTELSLKAQDSVGNESSTVAYQVPVIASVVDAAPSDTPSPSPVVSPSPVPSPSVSPSPAASTSAESASDPVVSLSNAGDYHFGLSVTNLLPKQVVAYVVSYQHGTDAASMITDALQGSATVSESATDISVSNLYFGTCSSTAGVVCEPHLGVANIKVDLTISSPDSSATTLYHYTYPDAWTIESAHDSN